MRKKFTAVLMVLTLCGSCATLDPEDRTPRKRVTYPQLIEQCEAQPTLPWCNND